MNQKRDEADGSRHCCKEEFPLPLREEERWKIKEEDLKRTDTWR